MHDVGEELVRILAKIRYLSRPSPSRCVANTVLPHFCCKVALDFESADQSLFCFNRRHTFSYRRIFPSLTLQT